MEKLSRQVDGIIKLANQIAREYEQEYVGTEHVLLAIAREGQGRGAAVLSDHGANEVRIRQQIDKLIKASLEDTWVFGRLPGTPHFRNVMAKAIEEARKLKSAEVCSEHLLLGLLTETGSVGQSALKSLGLTTKSVRESLARLTKEA